MRRCNARCDFRTRRPGVDRPADRLTTLGADLVAMVCAHCDYRTAVGLLLTCRRVRPDDGTFRLIAELQWGRAFWEEALGRPTYRKFVSMRDELYRIDRHQRLLREKNMAVWTTIDDFRVLWHMEAMLCHHVRDDETLCRSLVG